MSTVEAASSVVDVPASRSFEPEFFGPWPRTIPDDLRRGPYARRQRQGVIALAAAGLGCLVVSRIPGLDVLSVYLPPLAYLPWIGLGLLALAAVRLLDGALRPGPFRYIRDGVAIPARVVDLVKAPSAIVNGQPARYAFTATIAVRHPENGGIVVLRSRSREFAASRRERYETPFRVGDEVTACFLPGRFDKTLKLYAFLDLNPSLALRQSAGSPASPWALAGLLLALPAIFAVLFANIYAFGRFHPVAFEYRRAWLPMVAGAVLIGGGVLTGLALGSRRDQRRTAERNSAARREGQAVEPMRPFLGSGARGWVLRVVVAAGSILIGVVTALCWAFMFNAWADRSAAQPVPAMVHRATETTHGFIFREYELEYALAGSDEKLTMLTTPEHIDSFGVRCATAFVKDGRLGWRWVERLEPSPGGCGGTRPR